MSDPGKAVFLSYASQDAEAAKRICEALRVEGIEVWFDSDGGLEHGDEWDAKIRKQIKECVLFIPIISASTQARHEGYFRIEWELAAQRAMGIASGVPFILPVVIDETREPEALVPDRFRAVQWTKLPGGAVTPEVTARFLKLWSQRAGRAVAGLASDSDRTSGEGRQPGAGQKPEGRAGRWLGSALIAAAVVVVAIWFFARTRASQGTPAAVASASEARQLTLKARALLDDDWVGGRETVKLAEDLAQKAVALDMADGEAWATLARISGEMISRNYDAGTARRAAMRTQAERSVQLASKSAEPVLALATHLAISGSPADAEAKLRPLLAQHPSDPRIARALASVLEQQSRKSEATEIRLRHPAFAGRDPRPLVDEAMAMDWAQSAAQAEALLDQAQALAPTHMGYSQKLALMIQYRADLVRAREFVKTIPAQLLQEDRIVSYVARMWLWLGDGEQALAALRKSPRDFFEEGDRFGFGPKGHLTGWALHMAGRPTGAHSEWRLALAVVDKRLAAEPDRAVLLRWRALLLALIGEHEEAEKAWKLFVDLDGRQNGPVEAEYLMALGRTEEAVKRLTIIDSVPQFYAHGLRFNPWYAPIQNDPRVRKLIAEGDEKVRKTAGPGAGEGRRTAEDGRQWTAEGKTGVGHDVKSIAVLPFANRSPDPENAFFTDGVHEDILTNLFNIRALRVVSRTSVEQYRGTKKPVKQIGAELGAAYILEGSVQRVGNKVRVTGQLIDARTDTHLWAKSYDRDLTDVFIIQSELATEIAGALQTALSPEEKSLIAKRPTTNSAAYDLFLKQRQYGTTRAAPLRMREELLRQALALDPKFAEAWGDLAVVHASFYLHEYDSTPERLAQADAAIGRALALAPDSPEILQSLGAYAYAGYRDYDRALSALNRVLQRQPDNADVIFNVALVQRRQGRWLDSMSSFRRASALEPRNPAILGNMVSLLVWGRRWDEAMATLKRLVEEHRHIWDHVALTYVAYGATGSTREMDNWLAELPAAEREHPRIIELRKVRALAAGDFNEWKRLDRSQPYFDEEGAPQSSQTVRAAVAFAAHGDLSGARSRLGNLPEELRVQLRAQPNNSRLWRELSLAEAILGENEAAVRDARRAEEALPEARDQFRGPVNSRNMAAVYAWTGDKTKALAELERTIRMTGYASGVLPFSVHSLRVDPAFAPLRGDPRFEALLKDPKNNEPLF